jgi:hypothetical protein
VDNDAYHVETTRSYRLEKPLEFMAALAVVAFIVIAVALVVMLWKRRRK